MVLTNAKVFLNGAFHDDKTIIIEQGKIQSIVPKGQVKGLDLEGRYLIPGLVDLQLNGGGGRFFANDISVESIRRIQEVNLKYGTTSFLITLTTCAYDLIFEAIEVVRNFQAKFPGLLGLHVEGPYINPIKKGAHPLEFVRQPETKELQQILEAGKDVIKMITIAPEVFDADQIKLLVDSGISISAGHSNATYQEALKGFDQGISMATHLYNAMSALESRAPGMVGAVLNREEVWTSIIADGKHVDYAAIDLAYRLKKDRLVLISDAAFKEEAGRIFQFGATKVVERDGFYYTEEGRLAGSSISMYEAMQNMMEHVGVPVEEAVAMASERPAAIISAQSVGTIQEGMWADLLVLDENWQLEQVYFRGEKVARL